MSEPNKKSESRWHPQTEFFILAAAIVLLTVLTYLPALRGGFIWDDDDHLTTNPNMGSVAGLKSLWTTSAARICPLTLTSFWFQHALWGLNPLPYHLVNILLHAGSAIVLWRLLRKFSVGGAWFAAMLWALHPVQVESVAWITELKNTQSGFFYLLAILFFVKWLQAKSANEPSEKNYALAVLFGAMAVASKSSTVVLPLVLGLIAWWHGEIRSAEFGVRNSKAGTLRIPHSAFRIVLRLSPFIFFSAASSAVSIWTQGLEGATGADFARSVPERIATAGKVVWFYLAKLAWPHPLIFVYPRWQIDVAKLASYAAVLLVAAVFFFLWWKRNEPRIKPVFVAFAYFTIALLPVLGLVNHYFLIYSFVGDHFQYLASIGPLALAGFLIWRAFDFFKLNNPAARQICCALVVAALAVFSSRHAKSFESSEILWRDTLQKNPKCWVAENNLGWALAGRVSPAEEQIHYRRALALKPDFPSAMNNLGGSMLEEGRVDEALVEIERALKIEPTLKGAHNNYAAAMLAKGRYDDAIPIFQNLLRHYPNETAVLNNLGLAFAGKRQWSDALDCYEKAMRIVPGQSKPHNHAATALLQLGRTNDAAAQFEASLRCDPRQPEAHRQLADILGSQGKAQEASAHYVEVLRLNPADVQAHHKLGVLLALNGNPAQALDEFRAAIQFSPNHAEARNNLGAILASSGKFQEATEQLTEALRLKPDYAEAHNNMGYVLKQLGRREEAIGHVREALRLKPDYAGAREQLRELGVSP